MSQFPECEICLERKADVKPRESWSGGVYCDDCLNDLIDMARYYIDPAEDEPSPCIP